MNMIWLPLEVDADEMRRSVGWTLVEKRGTPPLIVASWKADGSSMPTGRHRIVDDLPHPSGACSALAFTEDEQFAAGAPRVDARMYSALVVVAPSKACPPDCARCSSQPPHLSELVWLVEVHELHTHGTWHCAPMVSPRSDPPTTTAHFESWRGKIGGRFRTRRGIGSGIALSFTTSARSRMERTKHAQPDDTAAVARRLFPAERYAPTSVASTGTQQRAFGIGRC